jgi:hypothetical protein
MYFLQYSRDKEDENGQAFLGINILSQIPCALKDSTGTHTTKLRLNFWLFELRHESEFQKF